MLQNQLRSVVNYRGTLLVCSLPTSTQCIRSFTTVKPNWNTQRTQFTTYKQPIYSVKHTYATATASSTATAPSIPSFLSSAPPISGPVDMSLQYKKTQIISANEFKDFTADSVGKFLHFAVPDLKKYFPEGLSGKLEKARKIAARDESLGLLIRPETVQLVNKLKNLANESFSVDQYILLDGERGSGKSVIMQQAVFWARQNNWLVFNIPSGFEWVTGKYLNESAVIPQVFDQPEVGFKYCKAFLEAHEDKLSTITLKSSYKIKEWQSQPGMTLKDLVQVGTTQEENSCEVIYHLRKELCYVTEYPVLIAIDGINNLFGVSTSFLDPYDPHLRPSNLPTTRLTLTRCFQNYKEHGLINGTVLASTTRFQPAKRFLNEHITGKTYFEVPSYTRPQAAAVVNYYEESGYVLESIPGGTRDLIYFMSEGKAEDIFECCKPF